MKSIFSWIALACFIQLSFSLSVVPTITILQDGIDRTMGYCMLKGRRYEKCKSGLSFSIWATNEGFSYMYKFKMLLEEPSYVFATCYVEPQKYVTRSTKEGKYLAILIQTFSH